MIEVIVLLGSFHLLLELIFLNRQKEVLLPFGPLGCFWDKNWLGLVAWLVVIIFFSTLWWAGPAGDLFRDLGFLLLSGGLVAGSSRNLVVRWPEPTSAASLPPARRMLERFQDEEALVPDALLQRQVEDLGTKNFALTQETSRLKTSNLALEEEVAGLRVSVAQWQTAHEALLRRGGKESVPDLEGCSMVDLENYRDRLTRQLRQAEEAKRTRTRPAAAGTKEQEGFLFNPKGS